MSYSGEKSGDMSVVAIFSVLWPVANTFVVTMVGQRIGPPSRFEIQNRGNGNSEDAEIDKVYLPPIGAVVRRAGMAF